MSVPQDQLSGVHILACSLRLGEESRRVAIRAASAPRHVAVRLTGGARSLSVDAAERMFVAAVSAFNGCNFTYLAGGTRMMLRADGSIYPGVTEMLPLIGAANPKAKTVGVIPRQTDLRLVNGQLIIADSTQNDHVTIVHPDLTTCLLLQYSADRGMDGWDAEWLAALDLMEALRVDAGYRTLHLFYGGGDTTEHELLHVLNLPHNASNPWWVVLVADSGGVTAQHAANAEFRAQFADRLVMCSAEDLRVTLTSLGFGPSS